jgi:peptidoglycan-associated lipoprotein
MFKKIAVLFYLFLIAACSSTAPIEKPKLPVVETKSTPLPIKIVQSPPVVVPLVEPTKPIIVPDINKSQVNLPVVNELKDPTNVLSKRAIYFEFDSNLIKEEFNPLISAHAEYLKKHADAHMTIQGNTDEKGSTEYNLALGQRRADAVKKVMTLMGTEASRIETISFGEEKPRNPGKNEESYKENRRADIVYKGE